MLPSNSRQFRGESETRAAFRRWDAEAVPAREERKMVREENKERELEQLRRAMIGRVDAEFGKWVDVPLDRRDIMQSTYRHDSVKVDAAAREAMSARALALASIPAGLSNKERDMRDPSSAAERRSAAAHLPHIIAGSAELNCVLAESRDSAGRRAAAPRKSGPQVFSDA